MAVRTDSAPAPRFHSFFIKGKAGEFPASRPERLALYAASALRLDPSRQAVEDLIETLIAILDAFDGSPDLEDDGTAEGELGARELYTGNQAAWSQGADDGREMDEDAEPWLGSLERGPKHSQTGWAFSDSTDREESVR